MIVYLSRSFLLLLIFAFLSGNTYALKSDQSARKLQRRNIPAPIFGVTIDSVENLPSIVDSLHSLSRKPTARIVFDEFVPASKYAGAVDKIHEVSFIMGELLDSFHFKNYTVDDYLKRTDEYLTTLDSKVDIWEIGNEINGNWLGDHSDVIAKMTGAYDLVTAHGGRTSMTLYHDQSTQEMLDWAKTHVPERMKQGLDYLFVSYYEDDQPGTDPDWPGIFSGLSAIFPNSKLGFGEVGTRFRRHKQSYIERYYNMRIAHEKYVGGYFWWYFKQDMVPRSKPLWRVLNNAIASR